MDIDTRAQSYSFITVKTRFIVLMRKQRQQSDEMHKKYGCLYCASGLRLDIISWIHFLCRPRQNKNNKTKRTKTKQLIKSVASKNEDYAYYSIQPRLLLFSTSKSGKRSKMIANENACVQRTAYKSSQWKADNERETESVKNTCPSSRWNVLCIHINIMR